MLDPSVLLQGERGQGRRCGQGLGDLDTGGPGSSPSQLLTRCTTWWKPPPPGSLEMEVR